LNRLLSTSID